MFTFLYLEELAFQHTHRGFAVLHLATLRLTSDDDSGRYVYDTYCGVGFVDVLTAGAAGTVGFDLEVGIVDLDIFLVIEFRHDVHTRK